MNSPIDWSAKAYEYFDRMNPGWSKAEVTDIASREIYVAHVLGGMQEAERLLANPQTGEVK